MMKMGHGADKVSKEKAMDDNYGINQAGVNAVFEEYFGLKESELHDWNSVNVRIDFEKALTSTLLTSDERLAVALVFGMGLNHREAGKLMKLKPTEIKGHIDIVIETMEAVLNGYRTTYHETTASKAVNLTEWIAGVRNGLTFPFDIPRAVNTSLLLHLKDNRDKLAAETLRQRAKGNQDIRDRWNIDGNAPYDVINYPFHKTSDKIENPMRDRDYKDGLTDGYDHFADQDKYNKIMLDDFITHSKALKPMGKKAIKGKSSDDAIAGSQSVKGWVY
jgi:hypothetical protein